MIAEGYIKSPLIMKLSKNLRCHTYWECLTYIARTNHISNNSNHDNQTEQRPRSWECLNCNER